jgi:formylglycine-generating enzyme required for sulfatase activity
MKYLLISLAIIIFGSCAYESSQKTGWDYNNPLNGGFQKVPYKEQETGPGLILIEGGTFATQLNMDDTAKTEVIVPSYYMDITEVTNFDWCEYLYWTERTFCPDFTSIYYNALPDTNLWRNKLGYSEPMEVNYLRHPSYRNYPVVGVSWMQASNYCAWRTDRVNENILIREGILLTNPMQQNEPFTTGAYLAGQYESGMNYSGQLSDLDPSKGRYNPSMGKIKSSTNTKPTRNVKMEDGILLPRYRLPTEVEWEYAATADESNSEWSKKELKHMQKRLDLMGDFVKNQEGFNYNGHIVATVDAYLPNDYGLYNMAGNVSEWVMDVYEERRENKILNSPFLGEEAKVIVMSSQHNVLQKYQEVIYDVEGMSKYISSFREIRNNVNPLDSIENDFLEVIEEYIVVALEAKNKNLNIESNEYIRMMFDKAFANYNSMIQNKVGPADYEVAIIPMLRTGLSRFIVDTPGNIPMRDLTPEESIAYTYNEKRYDNFANKLEMFKQDSLLKMNHLRVYKGASWEDDSDWMNPYSRRSLNKYESSATIGFRCAMDRFGSPVGLSKKSKSKSKTDL